MPAAWAGVAAAGISAVSSIAGAASAGGAVSGAASQANALDDQARQTGATNYANATGNVQPYISTGQNALTQAANLSGLNGTDAANTAMQGFQASPGYAYQMEQGLKAVDAGAASQGLLRSGATLKAEQTLGANLANNDFGNYLGRLNSLAGLGLQGSQLYNQATGQYNDLLTKTTMDQTGTITGTGRLQANNDMNLASSLGTTLGSGISTAQKNGLFGTATGGADFGGAGTTVASSGGSGAFSF